MMSYLLELRFCSMEKSYILEQFIEVLEMDYWLTSTIYILRKGAWIKTYYNPNISGISVKGVVTNIMRNQVQVRLQIDALKSYQNQYFYPYSSVAASPDGGGWYCMPKPGDPVRIFFPVSDESKGYAISKRTRGILSGVRLANGKS